MIDSKPKLDHYQRDRRLRSFAARFGQDSGRSAPCVQPKTPDEHQRENVRSARDVSPRSVQFSVAKSVQFSVAIDTSRMIPLESPVPEIGPPGSESGGRKRAYGTRTAARRESAG